MNISEFYKGKKVFITGHNGFKGSWTCKVLKRMGAEVCGYSLLPNTEPSLYKLANLEKNMINIIGDIREGEELKKAVCNFNPDILIHMAAQPLVRESYTDPVYTYETNVMGTVNVLEAVRSCSTIKSFLNVTTDKVYKNNEWEWGYRENDVLDGYDPYSNSKSCSELVTSSYKKSFFSEIDSPAISTARAGNVIGGGDFAKDRIIPDCVRSMENNKDIIVRNPYSTRPYEHVLEPVIAYLMIAQKQYENKEKYSGIYNVGPNDSDCVTTGILVDMFCEIWGDKASWINISDENAPHEANFLKLDHSRITSIIGWKPKWNIRNTMEKAVEWSKVYLSGDDIELCMENQIKEYLED
ncbi:CDP-glucose 4,6-dehydratase [Clostridium sp. ZBS17]|uniref:CDP-glucose 4,6-dehydratase n=1 Tax=Clostridium sp. ZBS17 TaxID=2949968 RepID=UPI0020796BF8|nr:CDP-glucose 4,6-dehydratase [Clostridium sp. ZBS17]